MNSIRHMLLASLPCLAAVSLAEGNDDTIVRVFVFAGQSNMVGADSKVEDIDNFPPFEGYGEPQPDVRFFYCLGRENKTKSDGWIDLQPIRNMVGPELSFARRVKESIDTPVAIIKVAAGGTHLGGDWNPREPSGFKMYPLALQTIRDALKELDQQGIKYRLEGFMWHQGENDMFNPEYRANYGKNLADFLACWRRDLRAPDLRFYIGELCTKTIWGMDLRPRMYDISLGQKEVANDDPNAEYVPTSHVGVEIGGGVGLHYHYGTLGQLQHGVNYAEAYLRELGKLEQPSRELHPWPYENKSPVKLFVLAGHRNMEGERAFLQTLQAHPRGKKLHRDNPKIAYRYSLGGGYKTSQDWEPMGTVDYYQTFGPELSFCDTLESHGVENIAVAKFTHSGSQIIDWTPTGSIAKSRNLYPKFIQFVRDSIESLSSRGHDVELAGIFYHVGENDMSWGPFRKGAPERVVSLISQSRIDLDRPDLVWFVSQQPPTDDKAVNEIDVSKELTRLLAQDQATIHLPLDDLPPQDKKLVIDTDGIIWLGDRLAEAYLDH